MAKAGYLLFRLVQTVSGRNTVRAALMAWALLASRPEKAMAQQSYYAEQPSFVIPVIPDPSDRRTSAILLHVSEDYGKSYQYVATASPNQRGVPFKAPRDGWYWFAVQTQDSTGQLNPASMSAAQPALKVCVDTQAPTVLLKQGPPNKDSTQTIEWELRDENLDIATMRLEYRAQGARDWVPLPAQQIPAGTHVFNPGITTPVEVRLTVRDKARNVGEQIVSGGSRGSTSGGGSGQVIMVRSRRFQLNYKIDDVGPSDVSRVEVYYTRDSGRTWRKYDADAPKEPPCILEVPEEGRYGFTLVARSGVDLGEQPPKAGDPPHIVVEVDETKPVVRIINAEVGRGADVGLMTLTWTASDRYLGQSPISISYARDSQGPWTPVLKDLPNTGRHVWKLPPEGLPFQFYLRVECTDQAGNVGISASASPVKVDQNLPKARVVGVEVAPVGQPGGSVAPAPMASPLPPSTPAGGFSPPPSASQPMNPVGVPPMGLPGTSPLPGSGPPAGPPPGLPPAPMSLPMTPSPAPPAPLPMAPPPAAPAPAGGLPSFTPGTGTPPLPGP
jgi:hypothetical protein